METVPRIQISLNLLVATFLSAVEIFLPKLFPGVVHHIVKKVYRFIEYGEQQERCDFREDIQSSQQGTCNMAQTNEQSDGESHGSNEDEPGINGEHEPDESKND